MTIQPPLPDATDNSVHELMNLKIVRTGTVSISSGSSLSSAITLRGMSPVRVEMPAAWTGKAALAFRISDDGTTYRDVYSGATPYNVPTGTSRAVIVNPLYLEGVQYLKLRAVAATAGVTAVSQAKNATLIVAYKLV